MKPQVPVEDNNPDVENRAPVGERIRHLGTTSRARFLLAASGWTMRFAYAIRKRAIRTELIIWLALIVLGARILTAFREAITHRFQAPVDLASLQSLLLGTGTALIGGTAIAASLVLFAMQVNVERLPYGLFRRLSADTKLLAAFAGSFLLAVFVAALSLINAPADAAAAIGFAAIGSVFVLRLFLYAYRRSLDLISPQYQLHLIRTDVAKEANRLNRRAHWAEPLLEREGNGDFDDLRFTIFQYDPRMRIAADRGLNHAVALARKLGDQGDTVAAQFALQVVVEINRLYVAARGRSFVASKLIGDNSAVSDPIIAQSLEQLKQYFRSALSQRDEEQMISALQKIRGLARVYLGIDYADEYESKTHACMAARQLQTEVELLVAHQMPDALYRAVGVLGSCACDLVASSRPEDGAELIQKIGALGCTGAAREDHLVITHAAMEQLSRLTLVLLSNQTYEISYPIGELVETATLTSKLVLSSPHNRETPFGSPLAPYYSGLSQHLREITNKLLEAPADDENAQKFARNVEEWADELNGPIKELLLHSVEKQSLFTLTLIHFIQSVTEALLAIASAPCCREHERDELRKHALWLVSTLSWLPTDREPAIHLENLSLTEHLFEIALNARKWGGEDVLDEMKKRLLAWSLAATVHQWHVLETGIYALAVLAVLDGESAPDELCARLEAAVDASQLDQEIRDKVARAIRSKAESIRKREFEIKTLEHALASVDREQIKALLQKAADVLSPGTHGEVRSDFIL